MCGICNIFRVGSRRSGNCGGCGERRAAWNEPCMKIHCASGIGTASTSVCSRSDDCDCVRARSRNCDRDYRAECDRSVYTLDHVHGVDCND